MRSIDLTPDEFIPGLLSSSRETKLCLLDSCGTAHAGSQYMIAGICPTESFEITNDDARETLKVIDEIFSRDKVAIFTLSYDFGKKLQRGSTVETIEPDLFVSVFDSVLVHDYARRETFVAGIECQFERFHNASQSVPINNSTVDIESKLDISSNFTRRQYLDRIESIKEQIRCGNTYQTNLTQQMNIRLPELLPTSAIFERLCRDNPAPFAAFIERPDSTVISASPERFFRICNGIIEASPIKGTRPRGNNRAEDEALRQDLLSSEKDRAENTMIVDLLRNDLGRVCEYGRVSVTELCAIQELPTLFHLVSTIQGKLRADTRPSQILEALFPCGSITGAPKLQTMKIIDELETEPRGLSMGAIGIYIPDGKFGLPGTLDLNVAIRTMVIRGRSAIFNVGGGIVIDSVPESEYEESLIKARALISSMGFDKDLSF
jgi:para-aminobenzoate synthetase component 1